MPGVPTRFDPQLATARSTGRAGVSDDRSEGERQQGRHPSYVHGYSPQSNVWPDRRERVFARTYYRLCRYCACQGRASVGQWVDEVVLERRRHDVNNLGRCHRRQRLDEDDVAREREADDLRTDEDGAGLGSVVADGSGETDEVARDGLADK